MKLNIFIYLFLFSTIVYSQEVIQINNDKHFYTTTKNTQEILIDSTNKFSINDIVNSNQFKKNERTNFPATKSTYWSKVKVTSPSININDIYFQNERAGLDKIDVFIFEDNKLIKKYLLGDLREQTKREILSKKSTFSLDIKKDIIYTIYIKYESYGGITTLWSIKNEHVFLFSENMEMLVWGLFAGIILTLIIYNFIVFFTVRDYSFIVYILFILTVSIYQLNLNGIFYTLELPINLYELTYLNWQIGTITLAFILLFPVYFFKIEKNSFMYKYIYTLFFIVLALSIFYCFAFVNPNILYMTKYTNYLFFIIFITLTYISIWAVLKRKEGAIYYLIGHISYLILVSYYVVIMFGYSESNRYSWIAIPSSLIFDIIFLSFALHTKIRKINKQKIDSEKLLISQSRFSTMGQSIANLTHQWKTPISQIASQIFLIKATSQINRKNLEHTVIDIIPQMENSISFLNSTIDDIYNLYANPNNKESFNLNHEINKVLKMFDNKIKTNNIKVEIQVEDITYHGYKNSFLNIIISIIENAIYQLIDNKIKNKSIKINIKKIDEKIILKINDNAGGIKNKNINEIFHIDYSTKETKGSGIGLALTKKLVEARLKGEIKAKNIEDGASFIIVF